MGTITLRALSALLHYPDDELRSAVTEIRQALLREAIVSEKQMLRLEPLLFRLSGGDLIALQEHYVETFDRGRNHSLHLFEHVHGESRDRGQAMVDLRDRYERQGLEITASELPDYLPLFLEYLSTLPPEQACEELAQPGVIIAAIAERLTERGSLYAGPMQVLADLAGVEGESFVIAPPDNPDDLEALDAAWAEEQIRFDSPAAPDACPQAAEMVARFNIPATVRSPAHG